jgi:hypothetical protein
MKGLFWICVVMIFVSLGAARTIELHSAAEIEAVNVTQRGDRVKVEVRLSEAVSPRVLLAENPNRLVLELPNTLVQARQQRIAVNRAGVKDLRIGLTSASPMVTRVVVDLMGARPYGLAVVGNTIALTVLPAAEGEGAQPGMLASGGLSGISETGIAAMTRAAGKHVQMGFKVKYVAEGAVYLAGGRHAGLEEGMTLTVREKNGSRANVAGDDSGGVAQLRVVSVAENSAVTEVHNAKRAVKPGDWAYLSLEETNALMAKKAGKKSGPIAVLSERPISPSDSFIARTPQVERSEAGRVRARIGFDYSGITGSLGSSTQLGVVARTDITQIGGTHWNLEGYWRGRITHQSRTEEESLQNVLNKTYTMQLYYENPESRWVAGFGRLYVPWANSLDTIDGGYVGRRVGSRVIVGAFAGSTPDPTSWHYNPDQKIGGSFVNFSGGDSESWRYTSTTGIALNTLKWKLDHPFVFAENGVSYKNTFSVYHSLIADAPQGTTTDGITPGAGISRSYLTAHYQPHPRISFDVYHNYFRDVPTASTALIGTGLVDKLLYQGLSFGVRVEPIKHVQVYTTLGESAKTGDARRSLNQMYGLTLTEIGRTGWRADMRYSKFASSFGSGDYKLLTLSRHLGERMMWDAQIGSQSLVSPFTVNTRSNFVDTSIDMNLWGRSFFQSGYTLVRGVMMDYSQWYLSLGYRLDGKPAGK